MKFVALSHKASVRDNEALGGEPAPNDLVAQSH